MELKNVYLTYLFVGIAIISFFLSYITLTSKKNPGNKPLGLLLISVGLWSMFYGFELNTQSERLLQVLISFEYLGIVTIPVFWLCFALTYTGNDFWLKSKVLYLLFTVPVITFLLVITNPIHHLFYKTSELVTQGNFYIHKFSSGLFYWFHIVYSYTLIIAGIILVSVAMTKVSKTAKHNLAIVLLASIIPYLFSLMYLVGIRPYGNIDLTPIGFLFTGILIAQGTFNKGLIDIRPLMLSSLFDSIPDAIIVVDSNYSEICFNPTAEQLIQSGVLPKDKIHTFIELDKLSNQSSNQSREILAKERVFKVNKNLIISRNKILVGAMYMITDITQEKAYKEALHRSEEQYRILFENAQEGILVIQDSKLIFFNSKFRQLSGYSEEELLGMHYSELIFKEDLTITRDIYAKVLRNKYNNEKVPFRLISKDKIICWVEFSSVIIQWNNKNASLLFINDISEQKQAEELKELLISISNTYINAPVDRIEETISHSLKEMAAFVNADRSYIFEYNWTQNTCSNTYEWCEEGISPEKDNLQNVPLENIPLWVETHLKNLPMYVDNVQELDVNSSLRTILELQNIKSLLTLPMMNEGVCVGFVGFDSVKDYHKYSVKERTLLEVFSQMLVNLFNRSFSNNLIQTQISIQQLMNELSSELVSVTISNLDSKIQKILKKTGEFFKVDRSYILRYTDNLTVETNTHEWCSNQISSQKDSINNIDINKYPLWKKLIASKSMIYISNVEKLPDEAVEEKKEFNRQGIKSLLCFPILNNDVLMGYFGFDSVTVIREWNENQMEVIGTLANILGDALIKVENEKELIRSKELAEAASIAKSNFLSNMSHEIRTPLNGVIGFTELLKNTPLNKVQKDYLDNTISSANSLLAVISDILDFSKIESGKMELESVKTDIIQLIEISSDIIKISAYKKGLELLLNIPPNVPRFAFLDPIRTKQILVNLLSNAVKFTHYGEIELSLEFQMITETQGKYTVSVRDTGIGIKDEDRGKLFKAFSQADTSTTRRYGGTGLGLIISNTLAKKMGGDIRFESNYGQGSKFTFDIVCQYEHGEMQSIDTIANLKSVLVVDDNAKNRFILEQQFKFWNVKFVGAESSSKTLAFLKEGQDFDLIIVDYQMPELDGLETVKEIRKYLLQIKSAQPIIILHSSSDETKLHEKALELGVKYMLAKPVKMDELYYYLCSIHQSQDESLKLELEDSSTQDFSNNSSWNNQYHILVAEDTPMNMLVIGNMIRSLLPNVKITEARNGEEAIRVFNSEMPDLIFMDVQMPELDGLEATKQIRRTLNGVKLPIIALTAGVAKEERESCFTSGMNDFISKPIDFKDLELIINKYLVGLKQVKKKISEKVDVNQHFNYEKFENKINSSELIKRLIEMSLREFPVYILEIKDAIDVKNESLIRMKVHKLKGSSLNMEFSNLSIIAEKMEVSSSLGVDMSKEFNCLEREWNIVQNLLTNHSI